MPPQNSKHFQVPFGKINDANCVNHPGAADIKLQPKSPKVLLDMRYFCNFSLVSLGIRPRSRRCAERTRQGEGRRSRPQKAALERSYIRPRIPVPRIAYFGRDKKLLTKYMTPKKHFIYIYIMHFIVLLYHALYISEAGSLRVFQWLRRERAAGMVSHLTGPGCLIELKYHKKRARHENAQRTWSVTLLVPDA